jgi:predicted membrane-bound dolichyl-phosphate-mannose-protein mannosyltransferase
MIRPAASAETRKTILLAAALCALVLAPALVIRVHPTVSESFAHDAIVSQAVAQRGFVANALDRGDTLYERRGHPPLLSYVILLNNRVFGSDEFGARVFSIIAGALCCLAVSLSVLLILERFGGRLAAALFGGLMLALLPVHLYVSRTANWDAVYSLFVTCALLFLALHLSKPGLGRLVAAGTSATLALLTCELGVILVPSFVVALVIDLRRRRRTAAREMGIAVIVSLALLVFLWPALILEASLARSILFRIRDNAANAPNLPWTSLYRELFEQSHAFALASAAGLAVFVLNLAAARKADAGTRAALRRVNVMMLPFAVYVAAAFIVNTRQRLVYVHHIADMMPPLAVLFSCSAAALARLAPRPGRIAVAAACALLLALSIPPATSGDADVAGPQEHPGFLGVRDYLAERPGARTYYFYGSLMQWYSPGANIEGDPPRWWTPEKIARVKGAPFDLVVSDFSMFDDAYPDIGTLAKALEPEYRLARVVAHRRTGRPCAWIFSR